MALSSKLCDRSSLDCQIAARSISLSKYCVYLLSTNSFVSPSFNNPDLKVTVRPKATLNIVAVTDDRSNMNSHQFTKDLRALGKQDGIAQPTSATPLGFVFHSIVGYHRDYVSGFLKDRPELASTPKTCPGMASAGMAYLELSVKSGGAMHQVCNNDWTPIFKDIANVTTQQSSKSCRITIIYPKDGSVPANTIPVRVTYYDNTGNVLFQAAHGAGNRCPTGAAVATPTFIVDSTTTPTKAPLPQP